MIKTVTRVSAEIEHITLEKYFKVNNNELKVKMTQKYNICYDFGHHISIIEDCHGHLIHSCGSTAGPPRGKIRVSDLDEQIKSFKRFR